MTALNEHLGVPAVDEWFERAACRGSDDDFFYPHPGQEYAIREAKSFCAACPVRFECLTYVMDMEAGNPRDYRWGIWSGHTPTDRHCLDKKWKTWDDDERRAYYADAAQPGSQGGAS